MSAVDPHALLDKIRGQIAAMREQVEEVRDERDPVLDAAIEAGALLAADVDDLDAWLSGGGELPKPWQPKSDTFVVAGQQRWGAGDTLAEAKRKFTSMGGRLTGGYVILRFDEHTTFDGIDQYGIYSYTGNEPERAVVQPKNHR